jgi:hypothetical protein
MSSQSGTKRTYSFHDSPAEEWSRLYVGVRAGYGRAAIQAALFLNGGASVALLAFLGNLAIAHQTRGVAGNYATFKVAFACFGVGVMLAASSNVVAFLIQNVAIARPREAEGKTGRRLRTIGIGLVIASLFLFAFGVIVGADALENLMGSLDVT